MYKRLSFWFCLAGIFLISLVCYGEDAKKLDLQLHLKAGQVFAEHSEYQQVIVHSLPGDKVEIQRTVKGTLTEEILKVDGAGNMDMRVTFKDIYFKIQGPDGAYEYDSTKPGSVPKELKNYFNPGALVGAHYTVTISPKGKVLAVQGIQDMFNYIMKRLHNPQGVIRDQIKDICDEKNIKSDDEYDFPDQPIGVGDAWTYTVTENYGLPMIKDYTCQFQEEKDGRAVIKIAANIKPNPHGERDIIGSTIITYSLSGMENGTEEIDEATGLTVKGEYVRECTGIVTAEGIPGTTATRLWPITVKTTETSEIKQVK